MSELLWFVIGFGVLLVGLVVLLLVRQHRSGDVGRSLEAQDLPGERDALGKEFQAGVHRGGGSFSGPV